MLTLRGEEDRISKALINVDPIEQGRWGLFPWMMLTGMPSARRCTKASKERAVVLKEATGS